MNIYLGKVILVTGHTTTAIQTQVQVSLGLETEIDHQDRTGNAPLAISPTFPRELLA